MLKKYYQMVLYIQTLLILLSILTYFAYLQALQLSPLLANAIHNSRFGFRYCGVCVGFFDF
jgi:hypothetical protein